jgi:hypothetical protein
VALPPCLRARTSVTAGTVLHRTRTPLTQWFWAAYLVTTHTPGLSALQLQRQLGIGRYETAWMILHKLRRAMVRPGRDLLRDKVEVDETCVGGPEIGLRGGRQMGHKALVVATGAPLPGRGQERLQPLDLDRKALEPSTGSRARISEVLSGWRRLTLDMIRRLHRQLGIPAEVLLAS